MARKGRDTCRFPAARIKKIMRADDDVGKITQATPVLVSCALELFLKSLVSRALAEAQSRGAKKLSASHLKAAVTATPQFDFLKDLVATVPDPVETSAAQPADPAGGGDDSTGAKKKPRRPRGGAPGIKKAGTGTSDVTAGDEPENEDSSASIKRTAGGDAGADDDRVSGGGLDDANDASESPPAAKSKRGAPGKRGAGKRKRPNSIEDLVD